MSKSLGNGVDPLDVIDEYGADALRFMLITGNAPGNDIRYKTDKVEAARNFANKIWNASRFVLMNLDKDIMSKYKDSMDYSLADKWILSRCNSLVGEVTENIDKFELGIASQKVYDFMWNEFCDWYIELVKPVMYGDDEKAKGTSYNVLYKVLTTGLQLLHPVMPYITEEIYQHLGGQYESIAISKWPCYDESLKDDESEKAMNYIIEAIKSIRNVRAEMNVPPSKKAKIMIFTDNENKGAFELGKNYFEKLAYASEVSFLKTKGEAPKNVVSCVTKAAELFMPLLDLIDLDKEIERLNKEKDKFNSEIDRVNKKLSNKGFVAKAPEKVVEGERLKGEKYKKMLEAVEERLAALK